jgi:S1-C subfamily serine protease
MRAGRRLFANSPSAADLAVVRLLTTRQRPSWTVPWQMRPVESSSGSGAIIQSGDGKNIRILTAAHVVADSTYVAVQRNSDFFNSEKIPARLVSAFHDADLALLEIPSEELTDASFTPLGISSSKTVPDLRSKVNVVGYPVGGDRVSVTEGVVSRFDMVRYSHSGRYAASLTVDSPINAGNSGGPIVDPNTNSIVGVAFQKLVGNGVENQGYGVPSYLIWRFLKGVDHRKCMRNELPSLGVSLQSLESPALRGFLKAPNGGVLVNWSRNPVLQKNDVIVKVDENTVDNNGLISFLGRRIHFSALIHDKFENENVRIEVLRDGEIVVVDVPLMPSSANDLVPPLQYGIKPEYLVTGGLVFQPLSVDYLQGWPERERPPHLQELVNRGKATSDTEQVIILTNILASKCNAGYGSGWVGAPILKAVDGVSVSDMQQLADVINMRMKEPSPYIKFTLKGFSDDQVLVLEKAMVKAEDPLIQSIYDIPRLVSVNGAR